MALHPLTCSAAFAGIILAGASACFAQAAPEQPAEEPVEEAAVVETEAVNEEAVEVDEVAEAEPSWLEGWEGNVEVGLNGSSGNTDRVNFRAAIGGKRSTESIETSASLMYLYAQESSDDTENRFRATARNDWLMGEDSPWRYFIEGEFETDEFQDWDSRLSGFGGIGYEFIDNDDTFFLGRIGAGASRQFGSDDEDVKPELVIGLDFEHQLTERQKLTASTDLFPDLDETGEFRWNSQAAWQVLVDPETNMSLKIGIENRYDSNPGDAKENDIYYFLALVWAF